VDTVRRFAIGFLAIFWLVGLALHLAAVGGAASLFPSNFFVVEFIVTAAVAIVVLNVAAYPRREADATPRWYCYALGAAAMVIMMWPMVLGSGVAGTHPLAFGNDVGVASGLPGDRHLNNHGRRVRNLTEEEYQQVQEWQTVQHTGFFAGITAMVLAGALYFQQMRKAASEEHPLTAEAAESAEKIQQ
jgi:hypothetical protein